MKTDLLDHDNPTVMVSLSMKYIDLFFKYSDKKHCRIPSYISFSSCKGLACYLFMTFSHLVSSVLCVNFNNDKRKVKDM